MKHSEAIPGYMVPLLLAHRGREADATLPHQLLATAAVVFGLGCSLDEPYATAAGVFGASPIYLTAEQFCGWQQFADYVGGRLVITKSDPKSNMVEIQIHPPAVASKWLQPRATVDARGL